MFCRSHPRIGLRSICETNPGLLPEGLLGTRPLLMAAGMLRYIPLTAEESDLAPDRDIARGPAAGGPYLPGASGRIERGSADYATASGVHFNHPACLASLVMRFTFPRDRLGFIFSMGNNLSDPVVDVAHFAKDFRTGKRDRAFPFLVGAIH